MWNSHICKHMWEIYLTYTDTYMWTSTYMLTYMEKIWHNLTYMVQPTLYMLHICHHIWLHIYKYTNICRHIWAYMLHICSYMLHICYIYVCSVWAVRGLLRHGTAAYEIHNVTHWRRYPINYVIISLRRLDTSVRHRWWYWKLASVPCWRNCSSRVDLSGQLQLTMIRQHTQLLQNACSMPS